MPDKKNQITSELAREIVELTIETYHKEAEKQREVNRDRRLHNTKLLMERYRGLVAHSENSVYEATQIGEDENFHSLVELMEGRERGRSVESLRESVARTSIMVHHIRKMLDYYEFCCTTSKKPEDARRLRVIHGLYIDEDKKTPEEMAKQECVDVRTIYRDSQTALSDMSALLFGYFE